MFSDDNSIENFKQLFVEFRKYLVLQKEYTQLELTEKLTILLSTLVTGILIIVLGLVALFYLLFALAYALAALVGGLSLSFFIIGLLSLVLMGVVYFFRQPLIIAPTVRFMANLFLNKTDES